MKKHFPFIIVGGGIVGSTAAYYLTRSGYPVILFDKEVGQASRAAAGIICPWFSKRRNKKWYYLVSQGAEFYRQFIQDLTDDGFDASSLFKETGTLILRKNEKDLRRDLENADLKRKQSPSIGQLSTLSNEAIHNLFPLINSPWSASLIQGGGRVDGQSLVALLHKAIQTKGGKVVKKDVQLLKEGKSFLIKSDQTSFTADQVLLAAGPAVKDLLRPLGFDCNLRPQKGQLFSIYQQQWADNNWPVIMSPGGIDILPFDNGEIIIGASHEDDQANDLSINPMVIKELKIKAQQIFPDIFKYPLHRVKVGTRAFTDNGDVLIGPISTFSNLWTISGLGSSGLTSGPYLAYQWVNKMIKNSWEIPVEIISSYPLIHKI
ncbi:FAD-binding oxidoreductase [Facklamia sp. 7083-14-GEN3]|uniref:NAD(P)/FAD-dependent oxidoreductase n=1 Tax=Facklamia sp. 7083-14-GEN3 TaxID=2973478 RepID=UPI00215CC111|nr:FAD-dependent oxidoreductase [Facklamia sp. 7083-14-GEN3]MCR8969943.1 FAD-binding oxidoreductase [Facklamia sp. 7083-14-GEN3]